MEPAAINAALALGADDLKWIFEECSISARAQAILISGGMNTTRRLAHFAHGEEAFRAGLKSQFALDAVENLQTRMLVADIISAWSDASKQVAREADIRAERRTNDYKEPPRQAECKSMRAAFIAVHGELDDKLVPGRFLVGSKLEELVDNEAVAEKLEEVTSREDGEDDVLLSDVGSNGLLRVRKGVAKKTALPRDGEELREKYTLINNVWLFARTRYANREWLQTVTPLTYNFLAAFILGATVKNLPSAKLGPNKVVLHPDWDGVVLPYEFEVRKLMYKLIRDKKLPLLEAMVLACKHGETRSLHLTAPFHQQVARYTDASIATPPANSQWQQGHQQWKMNQQGRTLPWYRESAYGSGKGQNTGKGEGSTGRSDGVRGSHKRFAGLFTETAHRKPICFNYNNGSFPGDCGKEHVCQRCGKQGHAKGEGRKCSKGVGK